MAERTYTAYDDHEGNRLVLITPWGYHTGKIPPPHIDFWEDGRTLRFAYAGEISERLVKAVTP